MSKKDHFDELFTSRLNDQDQDMDSWNTPSETVWENAKVHFPKPKKKRRFFIFLFPLVGLLAATLFLMNKPADSSSLQNNPTDVTTKIATPPKTNSLKNNLTPNKTTQANTTNSAKSNNLEGTEELGGSKEVKNSLAQPKVVSIEPEKELHPNSTKLESEKFGSNNRYLKSNESVPSSSFVKMTSETIQLVMNPWESSTDSDYDKLQEGIKLNDVNLASNALNYSSTLLEAEVATPVIAKREILEDVSIFKLPILSFATNIDNPEMPAPKLIKVKRRMSPYRWAVGLSTSRFIQNPFLDFDEPNENTINTKYSIAHLSIALQTGKRSSITTGLRLLNSTINVESMFTETYDANQPSESIASNVAESSQVGVLAINDNESAIMIKFLSDIQLSNGDLLSINSKIPLKIRAYSIPIIYKRQFPLGRFTPYLQGGISIDFFEIKLDEIFLDIRHKNQIIHEPVTFAPLIEYETLGSIYMGMGTQYNINDRWYGELGIASDLFDLKFTTIEVGIHYRF